MNPDDTFQPDAARYRTDDGASGWGVLKSHEGDRSFTRAIRDGRAVAVYAHRDVRDVVFSLMHKRGVSAKEGQALLDRAGGRLRHAIGTHN